MARQVPVPVEIGLSDDTHTEIVSGLNEGDTVVSISTAPSASGSTETQAGREGAGMMREVMGGGGLPPAGGIPGGAPPGR